MIFMAVAFWLVGIPVGTWLAYRGPGGRPMEVFGFWIGLVIGLVLVSIALVLALKRVADEAVQPSPRQG
jgi:MATE family multidrug resistance protein